MHKFQKKHKTMKQITLNIIEPTLQNEAGHCSGYIKSLLEANKKANLEIKLWIGRKGKKLFSKYDETVNGLFYHKLRRIQQFLLYSRLIKKNEAIFIPTAGQIDLRMLDWLLKDQKKADVFLHFHQYKANPKKIFDLCKIAKNHPEFNILAPTENLLSIFIDCGFKNCKVVPCPTYSRISTNIKYSYKFSKILYAGAARNDKGFTQVTNLVEYLAAEKKTIRVVVQISHNHKGTFDNLTEQAIIKLKKCNYPFLTLHEESLNQEKYQAFFEDAICLQLYDVKSYANKFSGITLDSLYAGCPIITTNGTWISDTVKRFNAGIVIENPSPDIVYQAIRRIISTFAEIQNNALQAGKILNKEHDPLYTLEVIKQMLKTSVF
jgi:glycosyltransferase involved in cell wall biosynthesis